MPDSQVFKKINNNYYMLTASEKKVADFVVSQKQRTQYMSISELASECGVAEATITRFCRRLEFKGFSAFKLAVAKSTMAARPSPGSSSGEVLQEDSVEQISQKAYSSAVEAIAMTRDLVDSTAITAAADVIESAGRVLCMGQGGSMIMANEAAHLFTTVQTNFFAISDSHLQIVRAAQLTQNDAVLYFSYSGATRDLVDLLGIIRSRGAKIILVTRFKNSPGAALADIVLLCGSNESPLQVGSVGARIAQLYLLEVLYSELCRRKSEEGRQLRADIADALAGKHI